MQKVEFKNLKGIRLSGIIHRTEPIRNKKFVVMVHGFTGDKDEKGLFVEAEKYFTHKGFSVFRFDMRGCGESDGDFKNITLKDETDDLISAITFLKDNESLENSDIYLLGFSLGATVSVLGYNSIPGIRALAFWSPAFFPDKDMYPRYQQNEILVDLRKKGYFIKSGIKVGKKTINNLKKCDLIPCLQSIDRPTLIVHGEDDDKISVASSERGSKYLNGYANFKTIPKAGHSFRTPSNVRRKLFDNTITFFQSA